MNKFLLMNEAVDGDGLGADASAGVEASQGDGNWYDALPEDLRSNQNITKFGSPEELAKSYVNAQQLIGRDKIPMPVTDDDWASTYDRLGRPEDVSGYKIEAPEGVQINTEVQSSFLEAAHKLGLNDKQAQGLAAWQFEQSGAAQQSAQQQSEQAFEQAQNQLKQEWGQAFDQNTKIAVTAASEFLSDADKDFLNKAQLDGVVLGNHPQFLQMFHKIGTQMMESDKIEGIGVEQTPQDMEDERNTLMAHPAYLDRSHPEHQAITRKVTSLFKKQFG